MAPKLLPSLLIETLETIRVYLDNRTMRARSWFEESRFAILALFAGARDYPYSVSETVNIFCQLHDRLSEDPDYDGCFKDTRLCQRTFPPKVVTNLVLDLSFAMRIMLDILIPKRDWHAIAPLFNLKRKPDSPDLFARGLYRDLTSHLLKYATHDNGAEIVTQAIASLPLDKGLFLGEINKWAALSPEKFFPESFERATIFVRNLKLLADADPQWKAVHERFASPLIKPYVDAMATAEKEGAWDVYARRLNEAAQLGLGSAPDIKDQYTDIKLIRAFFELWNIEEASPVRYEGLVNLMEAAHLTREQHAFELEKSKRFDGILADFYRPNTGFSAVSINRQELLNAFVQRNPDLPEEYFSAIALHKSFPRPPVTAPGLKAA